MATYSEATRNYAFLMNEGPGTLSRQVVTLLQDASNAQPILPGTVLGKITANSKYTPYDDAVAGLVGTGATVAAAILADHVTEAAIAAGDVSVQVIARFAEVKESELVWHTLADTTSKATAKADLANNKMIVLR